MGTVSSRLYRRAERLERALPAVPDGLAAWAVTLEGCSLYVASGAAYLAGDVSERLGFARIAGRLR